MGEFETFGIKDIGAGTIGWTVADANTAKIKSASYSDGKIAQMNRKFVDILTTNKVDLKKSKTIVSKNPQGVYTAVSNYSVNNSLKEKDIYIAYFTQKHISWKKFTYKDIFENRDDAVKTSSIGRDRTSISINKDDITSKNGWEVIRND